MNYQVYRLSLGENSTQGLFSIDGVSKWYTIEPPAKSGMLMPCGTYHCKKTLSPRLQYVTPELVNVPGHTGERIHILNLATESLGCIGVGTTRSKDWVGNSKVAFDEMMSVLPEEFDLTITQQANEAEENTAT